MRTATCHVTCAIVSIISVWGAQAQAHAKLVTADPAPNATVPAPKTIHLEFSEEIAKRFSSFKLTDSDGKPLATVVVDSKDGKALEGMPNATLTPGVYTLLWTAVSTDDGHKTTGSYRFTVK
jgi:copper resistance protein C